jgi:hypothetical protein
LPVLSVFSCAGCAPTDSLELVLATGTNPPKNQKDWHLTIITNQSSSSRRRKMNTQGSNLDASIVYLDPYKNVQKRELFK